MSDGGASGNLPGMVADRLAHLTPAKRALLERRLAAAGPGVAGTAPAKAERIAIVSMACRFPGGADTPTAFWQMLLEGRDAVTAVPASRWDGDALFDADPLAANRAQSRTGGFLADVEGFDAAFFGISPREAALMDPQQRLLLEVAFEALESGGQAVDQLAGSATGVFVGAHSQSSDYWLLQLAQSGGVESHSATGSAHSILANRVSYAFDLRGPSMAVDTACSSSLVAVHLACQSLRSCECDVALAGGVNLMLTPSATFAFSKLQILSPDGRCRSFDAAASGIARGEGCALVVLKRLADAERDGDPVVAVIAGSAVNQDGASNGLTAPNGPAQEAVIRRALAMAGFGAERYGLIETHGTGTPLGDPVEVEALARVIGAPRDAGHRCWLGAVKTNIGHLEAAAGIAGLVKAVSCLREGVVPGNLHYAQPNPHLRLEGTPFAIPLPGDPSAWPAGTLPRVAGVSSFGFGGTNAHLVLEEHRGAASPARASGGDEWLTVSARDRAALMQSLQDTALSLQALPAAQWTDFAHTARHRRSHHAWRVAVHGPDASALAERLLARAADVSSLQPMASGGRAAWVYTGQGGLWSGMGRELYDSEPVFRSAFDEAADAFERRAGWDLRPAVLDPAHGERLAATEVAQPALFALQVALSALWRSFGLTPGAVVGHSVGEVAAAHVAGVLTLEDAITVVHERSRAMQPAFGEGRMAQVECAEAELRAELAAAGGALSVAAINGPASTVLAGAEAPLAACLERLGARGIGTRWLAVDYAFHSAQMQRFVPVIEKALAGIVPRPAAVPLVSTVTGAWCAASDHDGAYWGRNVRETVRFATAIERLLEAGTTTFLEIGAHPALGAGIQATADAAPGAVLDTTGNAARITIAASLRRSQPARAALLASLCALYEAGTEIDWRTARHDQARLVTALPRYPWQRRRHWLDAPDAAALAFNVTGKALQPTAALSPAEPPGDCYEMTWPLAEAASANGAAAGAPHPPPPRFDIDSLAAPLIATLRSTPEAVELAAEAAAHAAMERRGTWLAWRAVHALAEDTQPGARIKASPTDRSVPRGVAHRHARLWRRLLQMAEGGGHLVADGMDAWLVATSAGAASPAHEPPPLQRTEAGLMERCGAGLAQVMRGELDALGMLLPPDGHDSAAQIYSRTASARLYNRLAAETLSRLAASAGRPLRVLEVGAGTGSTTGLLLPVLPVGSRYCFTDVSPLFLHEAKERFAGASAQHVVDFQRLDIGSQPVAQGFIERNFDVVVAANVLHATPDLRRTLAHVRSLLAPGGVLLLLETVARRAWADLSFGLTEGWWCFADAPLREEDALLGPAQWLTLLRECGFDAAVPIGESLSEAAVHAQAVLVARAPEMAASVVARLPSRFAGTSWWIVGDRGGFGQRLASALRAEGGACECVGPGAADAPRPRTAAPAGVVHCGALDAPLAETTSLPSLEAAVHEGTADALAWARRLAGAKVTLGSAADSAPMNAPIDAPTGPPRGVRMNEALVEPCPPEPRLWLVTRAAQQVATGEHAIAPSQSLLWGLGRSIALEEPQIWGGLVDLDATAGDARNVAKLLDVLAANDGEDQIALRTGPDGLRRHVARLAPLPRPRTASETPVAPLALDATAAYLVTGGYGGLATKVASWLADQGARRIVLLGRGGPPSGTAAAGFDAALQSLLARGVDCLLERGDVADLEVMRGLFARLAAQGRPVRGVVHAAAVIRFEALRSLSAADFDEALRAKVQGSWVLHELTSAPNSFVDLFVLFSSATTLFGAKGLAAYAAANQFPGALARHRAAQGLAATCVDWGAWSEIRLLGHAHQADITRLGYRQMADERSFALLASLVRDGVPTCMVADMDWPTAAAAYQAQGRRPFLDRFASAARAVGADAAPSHARNGVDSGLGAAPADTPRDDHRAALAALAPRERRDRMATIVRQELAHVLGLAGPQAVDSAKGFFDLGLDSLMAMQLRRRLGDLLGLALPATVTFNFSSVLPLAEHLLGQHDLPGASCDETPQADASAPAAAAMPAERETHRSWAEPAGAMATLSDDDVRRALLAEMADLVDDGDGDGPGAGRGAGDTREAALSSGSPGGRR